MPHPFVVLLQAKQRALNLSDARFSRDVLGVSAATWSQVQNNGRGVGDKVIKGAFRAFPSAEDRLALSSALAAPAQRVHRTPELPGRIHSSQMRSALSALTANDRPPTAEAKAG